MLQTPDKATKTLLDLADYMEKVDPNLYRQSVYRDGCGSGCIAYWATQMIGVHLPFSEVADLIGITRAQADKLFNPDAGGTQTGWMAYQPPGPKDAAKAVRHLAVTGEVPESWTARHTSLMAWYNRHKGLAGALMGAGAGSVVPVIGTFIGAVTGAFVGPLVIEDEKHDHPRRDVLHDPEPDDVPDA